MSGSGCPLEGRWRIARTITDLRAGRDAAFTGTALIARDPEAGDGSLTWHEDGRLVSAAHAGRAERRLRIVPAGPAWEVLFADGRPFHPLDLRTGRCEVLHPCGADRYAGLYALAADGALRIEWRVTGPAKDMLIAGAYRPWP